MPKETSPVRKDPRLGNGDIGSGQSRHDPRAIVAACSRQNAIYAAQASRLDRQRHCEFVFPEASLHDKIRLVEPQRELHSRHGTMQRDRCTGVVNAFITLAIIEPLWSGFPSRKAICRWRLAPRIMVPSPLACQCMNVRVIMT